MAQRALSFCKHSGCDELIDKGSYCEEHLPLHQQRKQERTATYYKKRGSSTERGYDANWQKFRKNYLQKHPLCIRCLSHGFTKNSVLIHHRTPLRGGGDKYAESNLVALCNQCHEVIEGRAYDSNQADINNYRA